MDFVWILGPLHTLEDEITETARLEGARWLQVVELEENSASTAYYPLGKNMSGGEGTW